jgi:hypothetical protein
MHANRMRIFSILIIISLYMFTNINIYRKLLPRLFLIFYKAIILVKQAVVDQELPIFFHFCPDKL